MSSTMRASSARPVHVHGESSDPDVVSPAKRLVVDHDGQTISGRGCDLTVVVPTRNEEGNIAPLVDRLEETLRGWNAEVLFVDDSDDDTPGTVLQAASQASIPVRLLHRGADDRHGGLGGAVQCGLAASRAEWVVVMDGDLQHPPEIIPELLAEAAMGDFDMVVASRYTGPGEAAGLSSAFRRVVSSAATGAAKVFFPRRLAPVSDPMSGFFILRRKAVDSVSLRPRGFKILLEVLARTPQLRISEVPFTFAPRHDGESKASGREMIRYLRQLTALKWAASKGQVSRFAKFALVGGSGVAVNLAALHFLLAAHAVGNAAAAALATQIAIGWNFLLTELWVFGRRRGGRVWARAAAFWAINTAALAIQLPLADLLDRFTPLDYVRATLVALALLVVVRFVVCELVLYPTIGRSRTRQSSAPQPAGMV